MTLKTLENDVEMIWEEAQRKYIVWMRTHLRNRCVLPMGRKKKKTLFLYNLKRTSESSCCSSIVKSLIPGVCMGALSQ